MVECKRIIGVNIDGVIIFNDCICFCVVFELYFYYVSFRGVFCVDVNDIVVDYFCVVMCWYCYIISVVNINSIVVYY